MMRILEAEGVPYRVQYYDCEEFIDGLHTADVLGNPYEQSFKTIVTVGHSHNYYVFVIPIAEEIDFKKAAASVEEKSIELLPLKEVTNVTGYVRGGCTAVGMKKNFVTRIDETAILYDTIFVSGGHLGVTLEVNPEDWARVCNAQFADLTR